MDICLHKNTECRESVLFDPEVVKTEWICSDCGKTFRYNPANDTRVVVDVSYRESPRIVEVYGPIDLDLFTGLNEWIKEGAQNGWLYPDDMPENAGKVAGTICEDTGDPDVGIPGYWYIHFDRPYIWESAPVEIDADDIPF